MTGSYGAQDRARDAHIRRLLAEHAESTVPAPGLDRIRERTSHRPWWRRAWDRLTRHEADYRPDPIFPDDVRCRICGERPCKNAAPEGQSGAARPNGWKEPKDMTIIERRARDVHAGDIIVRDPDHGGASVRWRVSARKLTATGTVIVDYTDITDEPRAGIAHFDGLTVLAVEPVGGAA